MSDSHTLSPNRSRADGSLPRLRDKIIASPQSTGPAPLRLSSPRGYENQASNYLPFTAKNGKSIVNSNW